MKASESQSRKPRESRGFTLLELVIVMVLIGLAMAGAITLFISNSAERRLRNISGDIELLAKRARAVAMVQQTPYAITFTAHEASLGPLVEAGLQTSERQMKQQREDEAIADGSMESRFLPVRDSLSFEEMELSIRRWGAVNWLPMLRQDPLVWRFDPKGMCEPMGVKLEYPDGWIELEFHPLTAGIRDRTMEARR
ncbi:MAG: prepilin-type N-terminal cleavage/methylation domain-containing protein [Verrucomicrobia bacterium]|jgi:prepilin-type N-terminal cleavage/methylation domain-containing protein|nr:MAG: prepilin-type N-terminal cleavage/methylation domain-containing protein [Verrucomicrobiota bacterium]